MDNLTLEQEELIRYAVKTCTVHIGRPEVSDVCDRLCFVLQRKFKKELDENCLRLGFNNTKKICEAINLYFCLNPVCEKSKLTKVQISLIRKALILFPDNTAINVCEICSIICDMLCQKYGDDVDDYCRLIGFSNTKAICDAICIYLDILRTRYKNKEAIRQRALRKGECLFEERKALVKGVIQA